MAFLWHFGSKLFVDYWYYCVWKLIQLRTLNWQHECKENTTYPVCVENHSNCLDTVAHTNLPCSGVLLQLYFQCLVISLPADWTLFFELSDWMLLRCLLLSRTPHHYNHNNPNCCISQVFFKCFQDNIMLQYISFVVQICSPSHCIGCFILLCLCVYLWTATIVFSKRVLKSARRM